MIDIASQQLLDVFVPAPYLRVECLNLGSLGLHIPPQSHDFLLIFTLFLPQCFQLQQLQVFLFQQQFLLFHLQLQLSHFLLHCIVLDSLLLSFFMRVAVLSYPFMSQDFCYWESLFGGSHEYLPDQVPAACREVLFTSIGYFHNIVFYLVFSESDCSLMTEGSIAETKLVNEYSYAPNVDSVVMRMIFCDHFWRQVIECATVGLALLAVAEIRPPEISESDGVAVGEEDIFGFDIPMYDILGVDVLQCLQHFVDVLCGLLLREALVGHPQHLPVQLPLPSVLQHEIQGYFVLEVVMQTDDIAVLQLLHYIQLCLHMLLYHGILQDLLLYFLYCKQEGRGYVTGLPDSGI